MKVSKKTLGLLAILPSLAFAAPTPGDQLDEIQSTLNEMKSGVTQVQSGVAQSKMSIDEILNQLKVGANQISRIDSALESAEKNITKDIKTAQVSIESAHKDVKASLEYLKQVISIASESAKSLGVLHTSVAGVSNQVASVDSGIKGLKSDIAAVNDNVTDVNNKTQAALKSLDELHKNLDAFQANQIVASIEDQLRSNHYTLPLYQTATQGGYLDLAYEVVQKQFSWAREAPGISPRWVRSIEKLLEQASEYYEYGQYSKSLNKTGFAYREIVEALKAVRN